MAEKIGIYVCHCGSNIAGTIDVEEVARWAGKHIKDVAVSRDYKFMCSSLGQQMIEDDIKQQGLTGVVVGACSPHLHERTFRAACQRAGLNPYLCQMTNLREHVSWVNSHFGTNYKLPIVFFTQLLGLAFGLEPKRLGFGKEIVAAEPVIKARLNGAVSSAKG